MDAKLRALKVVDLRHILAAAKVSVPAKATKSDLIAKILATQPALDAHAALYPPDDLLAPPEELDWSVDQPEVAADPPAPPAKAVPVASTTTQPTAVSAAPEDPELERRKQRAARFGIPLVEKQQNAKQQKTASGVATEQLEARSKRFGIEPAVSTPNGKKRSAQDTDPEELERRKKRSERFGIPVKS